MSDVAGGRARCIDLLHALKDVESDHRIRAVDAVRFQPALGGNRRHTGGTLVCLPRRAVARPMRPHRSPCHRRANHRWPATPCGSGTASHRLRSIHMNGGHGYEPIDKRARVSARPPPEDGGMRSYLYQEGPRPVALSARSAFRSRGSAVFANVSPTTTRIGAKNRP